MSKNSIFRNGEKIKKSFRNPLADPDNHQKLTTSEGSPLAHACQVWSMSVSAFVSYPVHTMTEWQNEPSHNLRPVDRGSKIESITSLKYSKNRGNLLKSTKSMAKAKIRSPVKLALLKIIQILGCRVLLNIHNGRFCTHIMKYYTFATFPFIWVIAQLALSCFFFSGSRRARTRRQTFTNYASTQRCAFRRSPHPT